MQEWTDISKLTEDELVAIISGENEDYSPEEIEAITKQLRADNKVESRMFILTGTEVLILRSWINKYVQESDLLVFRQDEIALYQKITGRG